MPDRSPDLDARAQAMRQQRRHLAQRLRAARYQLQFYGAAQRARDFLTQYRAVTARSGHLIPNPDRASDCERFARQARALAAELTLPLTQSEEPATVQAIVHALLDEAEVYDALARTAPY
ncbi:MULTISPECIES: hypothetical protein [unclassified Deinococcus]|uniref:hypothetical protein n=1 Tax=unclassified Deinococcus TaxID=2623546 RepID=UPI001C2FFFDE|nr:MULTISPECIES: hypothetical protein [unclassified Deinococcus]MDK2014464.1 hypothetical protein [Deinococcus sp. 43]